MWHYSRTFFLFASAIPGVFFFCEWDVEHSTQKKKKKERICVESRMLNLRRRGEKKRDGRGRYEQRSRQAPLLLYECSVEFG